MSVWFFYFCFSRFSTLKYKLLLMRRFSDTVVDDRFERCSLMPTLLSSLSSAQDSLMLISSVLFFYYQADVYGAFPLLSQMYWCWFQVFYSLLSRGRLWSLYDPEERGGTFLPFCFVAISIEPFRLNFGTAVLICGTPIVRPGSKYFQGWLLVPRVFEIVVRM